jgi:hypothetical protein
MYVGQLPGALDPSSHRANEQTFVRQKVGRTTVLFFVAPEEKGSIWLYKFYTNLRRARVSKGKTTRPRQQEVPKFLARSRRQLFGFAFWHPHPLFPQFRSASTFNSIFNNN